MPRSYLAVDIGTSFIKGAVVDLETSTLGEVHRAPFPAPVSGRPELFHEVDPLAVLAAVRDVIDRLASHGEDCGGILLCGQMGGLVLTSEKGEPLTPYVSWLDRRTVLPHPSGEGSYFDVLCERIGADGRRRLGGEVRPGLPVPFLFWLSENRELPRGAIPATLPDFVAAHLVASRPVIEWTGMTGSLDLEARDWPVDLLAALGLEDLELPEIVDFRRVVGECRAGEATLPVYAAVGDHQCAVAGTFLEDGELSVNISTGSQVATITATPEVGDCQVRPFFDGRFLKTVTNIPAGRALNVLVRLLCELAEAQGHGLDDPWPYILERTEAAESTELDIDLAFFPSPVPGPGALRGIDETNLTVGNLFRAAFQKMATYYESFADRVSTGKPWRRVVFSGGLAQSSALLRRLVCERLETEHRLSASTEDTLLGLLVLARVVSGRDDTVAAACRSLRA